MAYKLKSPLESVEVMVRYLLAKEKLTKDMKLINVEDHQWHLISSDHDYVAIAKV